MKWNKVKLTDISKPKQWKNLPISELTSEGYAVYGANGIIGRYKEYNHEFPTLAITCRGATCGTINITESKSYITSNAMALDDISENVDQTFLYYALNKRGFKDVITGAAQPQITREGLSKIVLDIPESKEYQLHIANLLSKAENLIAQRKETIRLLDEFLKSTFLEMFGDGKTNVKCFPIVKIEDISTEIKDGPHVSPKYSETGIPIFSSRNIKPGELVMEEIKYVSEEMYLELTKRFKPQRNDVLVTKGGTTGFAKVVDFDFPFCIWVHIAAIRPSEKVVPIYLEHYINSDYGYYQTQKNTKGAANRDLGLKKIAKIEMPLPPIELQNQFAQIVEKTEALKTQYQQSLQELENLYGSLSQKAFRGELSINKAVSV